MAAIEAAVVIITGATGGFGRAIAKCLADEGFFLFITGRSRSRLTELENDLRNCGLVVASICADLGESGAMGSVAAEALRVYGRIDDVVNNAAMFGPIGPTWEVDSGDWWHAMEVNLRGTFDGCRGVLPHMIFRGRGRIVNVTSNADRTRWPLASTYSVSKAAVTKLSENLAYEVRRHGICLFAFHPGILDVGLSRTIPSLSGQLGAVADPVTAWVTRQMKQGKATPLPVAVAGMVLLLSGHADHLLGQYVTTEDLM